MTKHIYYNSSIRCSIKFVKYLNHFHCQLEKKVFVFTWVNVESFLTLKEGFWGEDWHLPNPMCNSYNLGDESECWKTGTLNIENRVRQMFKEYLNDQSIIKSSIKKLEAI